MVALASNSSAHEEVDARELCTSSQPQLTEQDPASKNQKGGGGCGEAWAREVLSGPSAAVAGDWSLVPSTASSPSHPQAL